MVQERPGQKASDRGETLHQSILMHLIVVAIGVNG